MSKFPSENLLHELFFGARLSDDTVHTIRLFLRRDISQNLHTWLNSPQALGLIKYENKYYLRSELAMKCVQATHKLDDTRPTQVQFAKAPESVITLVESIRVSLNCGHGVHRPSELFVIYKLTS